MPYSVKGFFEINKDMVQILLMLDVLFTQDSKVEDLFCDAYCAGPGERIGQTIPSALRKSLSKRGDQASPAQLG